MSPPPFDEICDSIVATLVGSLMVSVDNLNHLRRAGKRADRYALRRTVVGGVDRAVCRLQGSNILWCSVSMEGAGGQEPCVDSVARLGCQAPQRRAGP